MKLPRVRQPHDDVCPHGCCAFRRRVLARAERGDRAARRRRTVSIRKFWRERGIVDA